MTNPPTDECPYPDCPFWEDMKIAREEDDHVCQFCFIGVMV